MLVNTEGRRHRSFALEVNLIAALLKRVNIKPASEFFCKVKEEKILKIVGPVHLLFGIQDSPIHPTAVEVIGNLRLLKTMFGTRKLLDGSCDLIQSNPVFINKQSFALSHGTIKKCNFGKERARVINYILARSKNFNFQKCEEMGVGQPKRCAGYSNCKVCSMKYKKISRKDDLKLDMIRSNLVLVTEKKQILFSYAFIKDPSVL